jgi:hypothetical protein
VAKPVLIQHTRWGGTGTRECIDDPWNVDPEPLGDLTGKTPEREEAR